MAGSGSLLHVPTGLNATLAAGMREQGGSQPHFLYAKAGWKAPLVTLGTTNFALDYQRTANPLTSADEGHSIGAVAVQQIEGKGVEVYGGFRWYRLDRSEGEEEFDDIYVGTLGTRMKF